MPASANCAPRLKDHYADFEKRFAASYRDHFASHERATYMIMAEASEVRLLDNSLAHLAEVHRRTKADSMVTVVALDAETQQLCKRYEGKLRGRADCVDLTGWVDEKFLGKD
eukprot:1491339-Alexandrium_andersonii.AAC.1